MKGGRTDTGDQPAVSDAVGVTSNLLSECFKCLLGVSPAPGVRFAVMIFTCVCLSVCLSIISIMYT